MYIRGSSTTVTKFQERLSTPRQWKITSNAWSEKISRLTSDDTKHKKDRM